MHLAQLRIECQSSRGVSFCPRQRIARGCTGIFTEQRITIGKPNERECEIGVFLRRDRKFLQCLLQIYCCPAIPVVASLQIGLVSLITVGVLSCRTRGGVTREFQLKLFRDRRRYFTLGRKQVRHLPLELLTPKCLVVANVDKVDADGQVVAPLHHAAGHHRIDTQVASDLFGIDILTLVAKGRTSRADL